MKTGRDPEMQDVVIVASEVSDEIHVVNILLG